jgi:alpha-L-rhamnosidase
VLDQAIRRGYANEAVAFIRQRWTPMLSTGTTWEDFNWDEHSGLSACHAWTSHPSYHFVNALAGIDQLAPGWAEISVKPTVVDGVDRVRAMVPSPKGDIAIEWEIDAATVRGTLTLPAGITAHVYLPGHEPRSIGAGGRHELAFTNGR